MATRCNIEFFVHENTAQGMMVHRRMIYKHWDGYPSNVLKLIEEFVAVNKAVLSDVGTSIVEFILFLHTEEGQSKTAYSISHCSVLDPGIEYYYALKNDVNGKLTITAYSVEYIGGRTQQKLNKIGTKVLKQ